MNPVSKSVSVYGWIEVVGESETASHERKNLSLHVAPLVSSAWSECLVVTNSRLNKFH